MSLQPGAWYGAEGSNMGGICALEHLIRGGGGICELKPLIQGGGGGGICDLERLIQGGGGGGGGGTIKWNL